MPQPFEPTNRQIVETAIAAVFAAILLKEDLSVVMSGSAPRVRTEEPSDRIARFAVAQARAIINITMKELQ